MNHTIKNPLFIVLIIVVAGLLHCVSWTLPPDCAGSTTQDVTTISGMVYTPDGRPSAGASVVIRSSGYLPSLSEINHLAKREAIDTFFVCSTHTDAGGYYKLDSIRTNRLFVIEAHDRGGNNFALISNIRIDSVWYFSTADSVYYAKLSKGTLKDTLKPPCIVTGTILPTDNSTTGFILVYGLDNYAVLNSNGNFVLKNMPSGGCLLHIVKTQDGIRQIGDLTVATYSGGTIALGELFGVFYSDNGKTDEAMLADNKWYKTGDTVMVPGDTGNPVKNGSTFVGWNSKMDGTGDTCKPGDTLIIGNATKPIYAQWEARRYTFQKIYYDIMGCFVQEMDNGGFIIVGNGIADNGQVMSSGKGIAFKTNSNGDSIYTRTFKVPSDSIQITSSSGSDFTYLAGIFHDDNGGGGINDSYIMGIDTNCNIFWTKPFLDFHSNFVINEIQKINTGEYVFVCETGEIGINDVLLMKTDAKGNQEWIRTYGNGNSIGNGFQQTREGGYVIVGSAAGGILFIKTDAAGNQEWVKTIGDSGSAGNRVLQTEDGGFIIVGTNNSDIYLVKTDENGNMRWTRTYGGFRGETVNSIRKTKDGGYVILGSTNSFGASSDIYLIKTNENGDTLWTRTFGGNTDDHGVFVQESVDGGYIILGNTQSYYDLSRGYQATYLIKTDENGNVN